MEYNFFDFLKLVGSLGMFLYGMKIMSEALQKIAGKQLRNILSAMTKNRVMGVLTGVLITALVQSSSATTVMVVSFVNAGLLSLVQSIGVIMGANIGTTVTAWMISLFGFGKFSISALSIPLLAIGLPLIFSSNSKRKSFGEFIFGFSFLFLGLDLLKNSMPDLRQHPEILEFLQNFGENGFLTTLSFLALGTFITIIVQSSSATVAITLIMCSKGWIGFEPAAAMIMGENIGTTITANIAALSGNISAKRAAFSHFMFNVFGVIWMLFVFHYFVIMVENIVTGFAPENPREMQAFLSTISPEQMKLIESSDTLSSELAAVKSRLLGFEASMSYGLSLFHTLFNVINVSIMIWFVKLYEKICIKVIRPKKGDEDDVEFQLQYISSGLLSTSELSILQAEKEMEVYGMRTRRMFGFVRRLAMSEKDKKSVKFISRIEKYEGISDRMELEIADYLNKVANGGLSSESKMKLRNIMRCVTEIESMADACHNLGKTYRRKMEGDIAFPETLNKNINDMFDLLETALDQVDLVLKQRETKEEDLNRSINIETLINETRALFRRKNIEDVNDGIYPYQTGVIYMDIINECEHLADYIMNVMQALYPKK